MDIAAASSTLSKLDLAFSLGDLRFSVLWFRVMQVEGDWIIHRHTHSSYEFHFVAAGACRVRLDDGAFFARAGTFYLTAPGVFHEQAAAGTGGYLEYSIDYDVAGTPEPGTEEDCLLQALRGAPCRAMPDAGGIALFERALLEAERRQLGYYNNIRSLALQLWVAAARSLQGAGGSAYRVPRKQSADEQRFLEIERFAQDNAAAPLCVGDLSRHFYLSEKQISRIIKRCTGLPAKSYLNAVRLKKAKELLKETRLSAREIAERLGFSSEYYFSQFFKREEGYPPGVFRANVQKA